MKRKNNIWWNEKKTANNETIGKQTKKAEYNSRTLKIHQFNNMTIPTNHKPTRMRQWFEK